MLYIIIRRTNYVDIELQWHIGEKNPCTYCNNISEIQADGDELEHIRNMFPQPKDIYGEPCSPLIPKGKVVRIFGDLAKTIVANLEYK